MVSSAVTGIVPALAHDRCVNMVNDRPVRSRRDLVLEHASASTIRFDRNPAANEKRNGGDPPTVSSGGRWSTTRSRFLRERAWSESETGPAANYDDTSQLVGAQYDGGSYARGSGLGGSTRPRPADERKKRTCRAAQTTVGPGSSCISGDDRVQVEVCPAIRPDTRAG